MEGFLETTYDKFIFRVKEGYLYLKEDFWAKIEENLAWVGLSDFLQKSQGDVAFLETIEAGAEVRQGDKIGTIETIKATFGIISPLTGRILAVNPELENNPYLLNEDPYEAGWIYTIQPTRLEEDRAGLLSAEAYMELMKEKIAQEMKTK
jgi:glycine cleavage system H protein